MAELQEGKPYQGTRFHAFGDITTPKAYWPKWVTWLSPKSRKGKVNSASSGENYKVTWGEAWYGEESIGTKLKSIPKGLESDSWQSRQNTVLPAIR